MVAIFATVGPCLVLPSAFSEHYQTALSSPRDGLSPAVGIELCENGGDVKLCGVEGDSQSTCDRLVGGTICHCGKHFELARR
jgi:hypothetical protein